jgi:calcyclin binding protein
MVQIEVVDDDEVPPSQERLLDAEAIEEAAAKITRPTARMHLESLAKKLRRESDALRRVEKSQQDQTSAEESSSLPEAAAESTTKTASSSPATDPVAASTTSQDTPAPKSLPATLSVPKTGKYTSVDRFSFDAGGNAPFVTLYVPLPGVGSIDRSLIRCDYTATSFDLVVNDLKGKSYRLVKDNLEKDIIPATSKIIIKADKVIVKLQKIKSEYGSYDYWQQLTAKKNRAKEKDDPNKSIMNLMKDMYDDGDDNMKKMIGETMMKQNRGELNKDSEFEDTF